MTTAETDTLAPAECKRAGGVSTAEPRPWADEQRAADKDALADYALERPDGTPFVEVVRAVLGNEHGEYTSGDHRLARRFFERHEWFRIDRRDGLYWVEPTVHALQAASLDTASKHSARKTGKSQDSGDMANVNGEGVASSSRVPTTSASSSAAAVGSGSVATANARAMCRRRRTVDTMEERGDLVGAFAAKRAGTDDRFHAFEDSFNPGEHLLVPFSTRFNSARRVSDLRRRWETAWERAGVSYDSAVMVTLTTDPARYESIEAAVEGLLMDVERLRSWLAYDPASGPSRPGVRLPSIVVPQPTERGVPHVHVVFFGVPWVTTHAALRGYWDGGRGRGSIVWVDRLSSRGRGGRWRWASTASTASSLSAAAEARAHPEAAVRGRSPRAYLAEGVEALATSAATDVAKVQAAAAALRAGGETPVASTAASGSTTAATAASAPSPAGSVPMTDGGADGAEERVAALWRAAWFWATGLPVVTISPALRGSSSGGGRATAPDGTPLPADAPPRWRYVGTAAYAAFPASIRQGARVVPRARSRARPPPDRGGGARGACSPAACGPRHVDGGGS